ncbi:MAG TPA: GNAT family N-acetyltransferase [Alphaproteobacteria bacterium]|nr:GNAT family N-acetyltransferase [Alphaproteobacteria bacterium]
MTPAAGAAGAWRAMAAADLPAVDRIGRIVHPGYPEPPAVAAERLALFPAGCAVAERGGEPIGYALAHPGRLGRPPALATPLGALPAAPDCLYLHDIALLPAARGLGLGESVLLRLRAVAAAAGLARLALTAVGGSVPYWTRHGFAAWAPDRVSPALASYGAAAVYMVAEAGA